MDFGPLSDPSSVPPPNRPRDGFAAKIFLNQEGLRAGWSLLIYGAFWLAIQFVVAAGVRQFIRPVYPRFSAESFLISEVLSFAAAFGAALLMALLEQRPVGVYGLPLQGAFGKLFWQGFLLGLGEVTLLISLIASCGGYTLGKLALHGGDLVHWGALWLTVFVFVGLSEEFLFRGYAQYVLAKGIGFWPAAIFLSLVFGAVHRTNPGEGLVGEAGVAVTGLVFAFALRRTGNLWLAVGWHASFDFGETFLFSVPNSGLVADGHLTDAALHGAKWLTGGTVGPEASVFSFVILGASFLVIHWLFPAKGAQQMQ